MTQVIARCNNCGALIIVELGNFLNGNYKCYCGVASAEIVKKEEGDV